MSLDLMLEYGVRIDADLLTKKQIGCPECQTKIKTRHCPECGSLKTEYKVFSFLDKLEAGKLIHGDDWDEESLKNELFDCVEKYRDYIYFTTRECFVEAKDNPRTGDYMFFQENKDLQSKFIRDTIESSKKAFGLDLTFDDFGYFIRIGY